MHQKLNTQKIQMHIHTTLRNCGVMKYLQKILKCKLFLPRKFSDLQYVIFHIFQYLTNYGISNSTSGGHIKFLYLHCKLHGLLLTSAACKALVLSFTGTYMRVNTASPLLRVYYDELRPFQVVFLFLVLRLHQ